MLKSFAFHGGRFALTRPEASLEGYKILRKSTGPSVGCFYLKLLTYPKLNKRNHQPAGCYRVPHLEDDYDFVVFFSSLGGSQI